VYDMFIEISNPTKSQTTVTAGFAQQSEVVNDPYRQDLRTKPQQYWRPYPGAAHSFEWLLANQ